MAYGSTIEVFVGDGDRVTGNSSATFSTASMLPFGAAVAEAHIAKFNNDAVPDLLVVEDLPTTGRRITAFLGNAAGTFSTGLGTPLALTFDDVLVINADGDTISDIVTTGEAQLTQLRRGSNNLLNPSNIGGSGSVLAAIDADRDGRQDILLGERTATNGVRLLQNTGAGNFADRGRSQTTGTLVDILGGDFNGDRLLDALALSASGVERVPTISSGATLGVGNAEALLPAGDVGGGIVLDFDDDQILDYVVFDSASQLVRTFKGDGVIGTGDGSFDTPRDVADVLGEQPFSLKLTDLNGDRIPDIGVSAQDPDLFRQYRNEGSRGQGDGTFVEEASLATNAKTQALATGDLNQDGITDVVAVEFPAVGEVGGIRVLLGTGTGSYSATTLAVAAKARDCVLVDFNLDGRLDIIVNHVNPGLISFLENTGNPNNLFGNTPYHTLGVGGASLLAMTAGDFNDDGDPDLAIADLNGGTYAIVRNTNLTAAGFVADPWKATSLLITNPANRRPTSFRTGDFTGDGVLDLAIANGNQATASPATIDATIAILPGLTTGGNPNGTFGPPIEVPLIAPTVAASPWIIASADLNGDRILDIVSISLDAPASGNQRVIVLIGQERAPGRGNGQFAAPVSFSLSSTTRRYDVEIEDMNGDGILDLVVAGVGALEFLPGLGQNL